MAIWRHLPSTIRTFRVRVSLIFRVIFVIVGRFQLNMFLVRHQASIALLLLFHIYYPSLSVESSIFRK
jgi:hypothetical protein